MYSSTILETVSGTQIAINSSMSETSVEFLKVAMELLEEAELDGSLEDLADEDENSLVQGEPIAGLSEVGAPGFIINFNIEGDDSELEAAPQGQAAGEAVQTAPAQEQDQEQESPNDFMISFFKTFAPDVPVGPCSDCGNVHPYPINN